MMQALAADVRGFRARGDDRARRSPDHERPVGCGTDPGRETEAAMGLAGARAHLVPVGVRRNNPAAGSVALAAQAAGTANLRRDAARRQVRSEKSDEARLRLPSDARSAAVDDPFFDDKHAPDLVLAMFSRMLGVPRPDWPPQAVVTGFAFYDGQEPELAPDLAAFLEAGPRPIVFTLGSAAVFDPGRFFEESVRAASLVGRRAVLLVGPFAERHALKSRDVGVFDYAPFSRLFPTADVVVHQGGSGTTGQAMRAGRPMVIVPYGHDQPDNAMRVSKLGIPETIGRQAVHGRTWSRSALKRLIGNSRGAGTREPGSAASSLTRTARRRLPTPSSASSATRPPCTDCDRSRCRGYHPAMRSVRLLLVFAIGVLLPAATYVRGQQHLTYPPSEKGTVVDDYFGTKVPDPYRWMEDLDSKAVADWVKAENTVTVRVSRQAAGARRSEKAHHRDVELPEGQHAVHRRRANLLSQELGTAEAVAALRPHIARRIADSRDRSESDVARRQHVAGGHGPIPGRVAARVHDLGGGSRLADGARPQSLDGPGPERPAQVDALLRTQVDEGLEGFFLFALSGAARRQSSRSRAVGPGALLPPRRHAAIRRSADLRAQGPPDLVHRRRRDG